MKRERIEERAKSTGFKKREDGLTLHFTFFKIVRIKEAINRKGVPWLGRERKYTVRAEMTVESR